MKQRLLVMNGQRLVQIEREGQWSTEKVEKAAGVKPGIYNIYLAVAADKAKAHEGIVVHVDQDYLYQQVGKGFVSHLLADFKNVPNIGINASVKYATGVAETAHLMWSRKLKHGIS
ncbi:MAG: KfrB domain-containing protein [Massilia sp.]